MSLNAQQQDIVSNAKGKCAVIAGAGSGKTHTLIHFIKKLHWKDKVKLECIWVTTFTNKAAEELKERIKKTLGLTDKVIANLWIGTFHSLAYRYLRGKYKFNLLIQEEADVLLKNIIKDYEKENDIEETLIDLIPYVIEHRRTKNVGWIEAVKKISGQFDGDTDTKHLERFAIDCKNVYKEYRRIKSENKQLDFTDLIKFFIKYAAQDETLKKRFTWFINDESQDNDFLQNQIMDILGQQNQLMVGDPKQSIFVWRGATPEIFDKRIKEADKVFYLSENYRSSEEIITFANAFIEQSEKFKEQKLIAHKKSVGIRPVFNFCRSSDDEAHAVAKNIYLSIQSGVKPQDIAVLSRSVKYGSVFLLQTLLKQANIPYIVRGGFDMLASAYFQKYLLFLKSIYSPNYISTFNAIQCLPKVGPATAKKAVNDVLSRKNPTSIKVIDTYLGFVNRSKDRSTLFAASEFYFNNCWKYKHALEKQSKRNIMNSLVVELNNKKNIMRGIEQLVFDADDKENKSAVVISTIHRAKGLEWDSVHISNFCEGVMPSDRAVTESDMQEEFCLAYTALTRPKRNLQVYMHGFNKKHNKINVIYPSRFLINALTEEPSSMGIKGIMPDVLIDNVKYNELFKTYSLDEEDSYV